MARPPRPTAPLLLACALLLAPGAALAKEKVGYNPVGTCVTVTTDPGELFVTTVPALAIVYVDGSQSGVSSATVPGVYRVLLPPGEHQIEVRKADYQTYEFSACIQNGKITYHEVTLKFSPATPPPPPTPTPAPSTPTPSPTPTPNATPGATPAPAVTAPSLLAFLESSLSDGQVAESEEIALRAALDVLRAGKNTTRVPFTPANPSCRAIAASILRDVGGCAQVDPVSHPSLQSACCSPGGSRSTPAPRKSPGLEFPAALAAVGAAALLAGRRRT